jgi:hypothetical protein
MLFELSVGKILMPVTAAKIGAQEILDNSQPRQ